jgi:hypothetical protein
VDRSTWPGFPSSSLDTFTLSINNQALRSSDFRLRVKRSVDYDDNNDQ